MGNNYEWYIHRILRYDLDKYVDFYRFSIIREPMEKMISLYFYHEHMFKLLIKNRNLRYYQEENWFNLFTLYKKYNIKDIRSFLDNFKEFYYNEIFPKIKNLKKINETFNMMIYFIVGFLPQYLFITDHESKILVDEVVDNKNLDDWMKKTFNLEKDIKLNTHSKTGTDYSQFITEKNEREFREIYKKDYELFFNKT